MIATTKEMGSGGNYHVDNQTGQHNNFMNSFNEDMKPSSCHRGITVRRTHTSLNERRKLLNTLSAAGNEKMSDAVRLCREFQSSSKT